MTHYNARVFVRTGLAADVPALTLGELGFDTDTRTLRIGIDSATPLKVLTDQATGLFDFSDASVTFGSINLADVNDTVGGITLSKFNQTDGILCRYGSDGFHAVQVISGDSSLAITGGDGSGSSIDIRWASSPANLSLLATGIVPYLGAAIAAWGSGVDVQDAFGVHLFYAVP